MGLHPVGCSVGARTSKITSLVHLSSGSWVLSEVTYSLHFSGALCLYVGFLAQQSSESFLTTWWLASKRMKADANLLSAGPTTGSASFSWSKHVTSPDPRGGEKEPTLSLEDWLVYIDGETYRQYHSSSFNPTCTQRDVFPGHGLAFSGRFFLSHLHKGCCL